MPIKLSDDSLRGLMGGRPIAWSYQTSRGANFRCAAIAQDDFDALHREFGMPWLLEYLDVTKKALDDWAAGLSEAAAMAEIERFSNPPEIFH